MVKVSSSVEGREEFKKARDAAFEGRLLLMQIHAEARS